MTSLKLKQNLLINTVFKPDQIDSVISACQDEINYVKKKGIQYLNLPVSFDIETSSVECKNKVGIMYGWTFCFFGLTVLGRTWNEFLIMIKRIRELLELSDKRYIVIYIHNAEFEFQFLRKKFIWKSVFAMSERRPITATTVDGIEFRCSYLLSGKNLNELSQESELDIFKKVGDLDYSLIRHPGTPLTPEEISYMINDVKIVVEYIQNKIESDGNIVRIPMTKTGYVRKLVRNNCLYKDSITGEKKNKYYKYHKFIESLSLEPNEYIMAKRAFQGGFTHCNSIWTEAIVDNVASADLTSSYPAQMIAQLYPMSKGEIIKINNQSELEHLIGNYCLLFDIEFNNIRPKLWYDHPISTSKCFLLDNPTEANGRVVYADCLRTTITEQDYIVYNKFYEWDSIRIGKCYKYRRERLPKDYIISILNLYVTKTQLKGIESEANEYQRTKELLNSTYGMTVTDIIRPVIGYDNNEEEWTQTEPNLNEELEKYNKSKTRFLSYLWGIWITAYARKSLFYAIQAIGEDYIYSDTDSVKYVNFEKHQPFFESYNKYIRQLLLKTCEAYRLEPKLIEPESIDGVKHLLGAWTDEGIYSKFKTLGAKRYIYTQNDKLKITIAGLGKHIGSDYISSQPDPFEFFSNEMFIPAEKTGKLTHTYIDEVRTGTVTDYLGNKYKYSEDSSIHLSPCEFSLNMSKFYLEYLLNLGGRKNGSENEILLFE